MPEQGDPTSDKRPRSGLPRVAIRASPLLITALLLSSAPGAETPAGAPEPAWTPTPRSPVVAADTTARLAGPGRTLHVSPQGRGHASGTRADPLHTIATAVDRARPGDDILVRRGVYPERVEIPPGKRLRIRAAPGERVWLDGSEVVRGWRRTPYGFAHDGWATDFDSSPTYVEGAPDNTEEGWSFLNPARPMAAHPDQVWIDGVPQRQVGSLQELWPGTFFVDEASDVLHLGSPPQGHRVRASVLTRALSVQAAGTRVVGIGVRRFAPSVPTMGAVTVEAGRVTLRDMVIRDNATTGLHVMAARVRVRDVTTARNGMLGMSATYADGLRVVRLRSRRNNTEGFNTSPVAGGVKVGRSRRVLVRGSALVSNAGTGLWFDESSSDIRVVDTTMRDNTRHGLSLEISARALVADTVISGNGGDGIKVNNTQDVALWNNTLVGNGRSLNLVQDPRQPDSPESVGRDPRRPFPDPTMTWRLGPVAVHNNILARARGSALCLLCVEDYSERFSAAQLGVVADGNVYQRTAADRPPWAVVWSRGAGDPATFATIADFRDATGNERRHLDLVSRSAVSATMAPSVWVVRAVPVLARRLPREVGTLLGRRGVLHLGAWLGPPPRR